MADDILVETRQALAKELLEIAESGGDAFTRLRNVISALKDELE